MSTATLLATTVKKAKDTVAYNAEHDRRAGARAEHSLVDDDMVLDEGRQRSRHEQDDVLNTRQVMFQVACRGLRPLSYESDVCTHSFCQWGATKAIDSWR